MTRDLDQRPTLLVLGVGGNVSQGILKALRLAQLDCRVVGACTSALAMGLYTCDKACVSPLASDEGFLDWLVDCCRAEGVDGILSGVEPVLSALCRHRETLLRETGAVAVVSRREVLEICDDKLRTSRWLAENGLAAPRSAAAGDPAAAASLGRQVGYPLIAKPRAGKGSGGIFLVAGESDLKSVRELGGYVVQENVGEASEEYTAATFSDGESAVRGCIVIRRELQAGTTCRAQAGEFPAVRRQAVRIAEALRPEGPCNMQFRMRGRQPVCFEINARFSGTSPLRARFGFNDVEAAVCHFILGEPPRDLPRITDGLAVRYWNEVYLDGGAVELLAERGWLEAPAAGARIEDYGMRR